MSVMTHCVRIKGVVVSDDFKKGFRTLVRLNCKMWDCPYCGQRNAAAWRAYLLDRFNKTMRDEKWCFFTITASPWTHKKSALATLENLQAAWKKLYDRLLRHYGKGLQYVRVFEKHKSGRYHMHFLLNVGAQYDAHNFAINRLSDEMRHPECKWLRKAMVALKAGWRVHIRRVWERETKTANVGLVVGYLLKYFGKQLVEMDMPKYQRRIQTSRKIGSPATNAKGQGNWVHMREIPLHMVTRSPIPVFDLTTGQTLTKESFEGESYYPPARYYRGENYIPF